MGQIKPCTQNAFAQPMSGKPEALFRRLMHNHEDLVGYGLYEGAQAVLRAAEIVAMRVAGAIRPNLVDSVVSAHRALWYLRQLEALRHEPFTESDETPALSGASDGFPV